MSDLTPSILGWSAFAGVVVLFIAVPLNSFFSKRSVKVRTSSGPSLRADPQITQDLLKARDKRISVMSELITAIQVDFQS